MLKDWIIKISRKCIRSFDYEQSFDALFYFLNSYVDITQVPKATGALGELQRCDVVLLKIFSELCRQHGFRYWLDYGTLLGCYRHKGFIPWDDDMDVCMPYEDYIRARDIFKTILNRYGIDFQERPDWPRMEICMSYKHSATGIWLDIFPVDEMTGVSVDETNFESLKNKLIEYKKYYRKNRSKKTESELEPKRRKTLEGIKPGNGTIVYHGPEFDYPKYLIHDKKTIYPLTTMPFEGIDACVPNNPAEYLQVIYGPRFMEFPRGGVTHHGSEEGSLYEWAEIHGVDMDSIHTELEGIYKQIKEVDNGQ